MRDAVAVRDHQRRAVIGLRLAEGAQRLLRIGAHRDPGHIHTPVGDRLQRDVLLGYGLAPCGKLGDGAERRRLGRLPAGVGVDLGVEQEHVHVAPACQDVVEPTGADVVGPAVAADDPHAAPDQVIHDAAQVRGGRAVKTAEPPLQLGHPVVLRAQLRLAQLWRAEDVVGKLRADHVPQLGEAVMGQLIVLVGGQPEAKAEFGVVLEQGVGPGRARARPRLVVHGVVGRLPP